MLRSAVALSVVNNVIASVRANAIAVKVGMQIILHHLKWSFGDTWHKSCQSTCGTSSPIGMFMGLLGMSRLVPAYATASERRSYRRYLRERS